MRIKKPVSRGSIVTNGSPAASVGKPRDHGQDTLPPTEAQLKARAFVDAVIADGAVREGVVVKTDQVQWSARLLVLSQFTGRSYSKSETPAKSRRRGARVDRACNPHPSSICLPSFAVLTG